MMGTGVVIPGVLSGVARTFPTLAGPDQARPERAAHSGEGGPQSDRVTLSAAVGRLTLEQQIAVARLAETDRRVRAHEQAHLVAAGGYARGAPSYSYVTGPDGKVYAVGGEVSIDASPVPGNPEETIRKAEVVRAAANAPADPSPQDRQVAAAAAQMEMQARLELAAKQAAEAKRATPADPRLWAYSNARAEDGPQPGARRVLELMV